MSDMTLPCDYGVTLHIKGTNIVVEKKKGEEVIPISNIQTVKLIDPTLWQGQFQFTTAQGSSGAVNMGFGMLASIGSLHTFYYHKKNYELAKKFRDAIVGVAPNAIQDEDDSEDEYFEGEFEGEEPAAVVDDYVVDQLRNLKLLCDEGILTEEEFSAKKKQILGI